LINFICGLEIAGKTRGNAIGEERRKTFLGDSGREGEFMWRDFQQFDLKV
jgi:hypothetical protein